MSNKIVIGIIENDAGHFWVQQRQSNQLMPYKWEFPGGKIEHNETCLEAVTRELNEEVGLNMQSIIVDYCRIKLQFVQNTEVGTLQFFVFLIKLNKYIDINKQVYCREGQNGMWIDKKNLSKLDMPSASKTIILCIHLEDIIWVTPEFSNLNDLIAKIKEYNKIGIKQLILRQRNWSLFTWQQNLQILIQTFKELQIKFSINSKHIYKILNYTNLTNKSSNFIGIHLNSTQLMNCHNNFIDEYKNAHNKILISASVHNKEELQKAEYMSINFLLISPILPTQSHPNTKLLNWTGFKNLIDYANVPSYGLGGMRIKHLSKCHSFGAQGLAFMNNLET